MRPRFEPGTAVRVMRNVRNDGTYPGVDTGTLLVRRGSVGHVRSIGTFLQDQIVYGVHFLDDGRLVGCREEELIGAAEPWVPSRFEGRDFVVAARTLAIGGEVKVAVGTRGQVVKVLREAPGPVTYHVLFGDRVFQVQEAALGPAETDA